MVRGIQGHQGLNRDGSDAGIFWLLGVAWTVIPMCACVRQILSSVDFCQYVPV